MCVWLCSCCISFACCAPEVPAPQVYLDIWHPDLVFIALVYDDSSGLLGVHDDLGSEIRSPLPIRAIWFRRGRCRRWRCATHSARQRDLYSSRAVDLSSRTLLVSYLSVVRLDLSHRDPTLVGS